MTENEIKVNWLIVEAIDKMIEKYNKKAVKEKEKARSGKITYKGEVYETERDIMDAYACDCFSDSVCDKLIERLNKAKGLKDSGAMTESEQIVFCLSKYKTNLLTEVYEDNKQKKLQEQKDERMRELIAEGNSYREAQAIIGNHRQRGTYALRVKGEKNAWICNWIRKRDDSAYSSMCKYYRERR